MASWSVCSTVAEPPELLCAFVAHYLEQGAEEVHLFLDAPDRDTVKMLTAIKGVRVTECTPAYWKKINNGRPDGQVMRQLKNANRAYAQCTTDWFYFCDADEFTVARDGIGAALDRVPLETRFCRPQMAERVFPADAPQEALFDGLYRKLLPPRPKMVQRIYGDLAPMTTRGLTGHVASKSFVRSGQSDLRIRIHFPVPFDGAEEERRRKAGDLRPGPFMPDTWLVHFDGVTLLHWKLKLLRFYLDYAPQMVDGQPMVFKNRTPARSRQLNTLFENRDDPEMLNWMMGLIRLRPDVLDRLRAEEGLVEDISLDPAQAAERVFGPGLDFRAASFDARLREKYGALIAEHGLLD